MSILNLDRLRLRPAEDKTQAAAATTTAAAAEQPKKRHIINRLAVLELCHKLSISKEFTAALEREVIEIIRRACNRCESNHRRRLLGRDL